MEGEDVVRRRAQLPIWRDGPYFSSSVRFVGVMRVSSGVCECAGEHETRAERKGRAESIGNTILVPVDGPGALPPNAEDSR